MSKNTISPDLLLTRKELASAAQQLKQTMPAALGNSAKKAKPAKETLLKRGTGLIPQRKKRRKKKAQRPLQIKRSPKYNPTGETLKELVERLERSKHAENEWIHIYQGGAIESNRRRH